MDTTKFGQIWDILETTQEPLLERDQIMSFLDEARLRKTPLSPRQWEAVNAALWHVTPHGLHFSVEQYGDDHRYVYRKPGTMLPSESGDNTP